VALNAITEVIANSSKPFCMIRAATPRTIARPNVITRPVTGLRASSIDKITRDQRRAEESILYALGRGGKISNAAGHGVRGTATLRDVTQAAAIPSACPAAAGRKPRVRGVRSVADNRFL
jgi:hypothetical protein